MAIAAKKELLTGRDVDVLCALYKYRYLTAPQLQRLFFPSLQTAYRRLRSLHAQELVTSFQAPNIKDSLHYLGGKGLDLVATTLGAAPAELKWNRPSKLPKDYYFLAHFLELNDFRIALTLSLKRAPLPLSLLGFIPEYFGETADDGIMQKYIKDFILDVRRANHKINHTPDAVFALSKHNTPALFFVEIDRGTETVSDPDKGVLKAVAFYLHYLLTEKYQRYREDFGCAAFRGFRALFVTTSEARVANIRRAAAQLPGDPKAKRFIWLTHQSHAQDFPLGPIWLSADSEDQTVYRIN